VSTVSSTSGGTSEHSLFYYPYTSVQESQSSLLQSTALYFDKLYVLDPDAAIAGAPGAGIGPAQIASDAKLLEREGLLERVPPAEVLEKYGDAIARAIHFDLKDEDFIAICRRSGYSSWELALEKVPGALQQEEAMRQLLKGPYERVHKDRVVADETGIRVYEDEYWRERLNTEVFTESSSGQGRKSEYRWARFTVEAGESIMINHALLASLAVKRATPVTDDPLHRQALEYKLRDISQYPDMPVRWKQDEVRQNELAYAFLSERRISLPALHPDIPIETVLQMRRAHLDELENARQELYWLARRLESEPFTPEFQEELDRVTIPNLRDELKSVEAAQKSWLEGRRLARFKVGGVTLAAAGTILGLVFGPVAAAAATAGGVLALLGGIAKDAPDVMDAFRSAPPSGGGLSYFLEKPQSAR
jgi:hypothetical protein